MKSYGHFTLAEYTEALAAKSPVPGGGSAAALTAVLGAALISMVARYSIGKGTDKTTERRLGHVLKKSETIRRRLFRLVDLDTKVYLKVVQTRRARTARRQRAAALKAAGGVPLEVARLCFQAIQLTPFLITKGNKNLVSDVAVAGELLWAAFQAGLMLAKTDG